MAKRAVLVVAATVLSLGACQASQNYHGYVPDQVEPTEVEANVDTRSTVLARLGSPSTTSVFDDDVWFYISSTRRQMAFYKPKVTERKVVAIKFNDEDVVEAVEVGDITDGQIVEYASRETPTRGRELGLLEQLFGTIGRLPSQLPGQERGPGDSGP
ncbi:MAG: outer membrane protein assembly factor BamE [Pseudomonadota bacterium]